MKQKNFLFKSALLLVVLFSGASASWADAVTLASWSSETTTEYTNNGSGCYTPSSGTRTDLKVAYSSRIYLYPSAYLGTQSNYKLSFYSSDASKKCGFYSTTEDRFWMELSDNSISDFTNGTEHDNYVEVTFPTTGYKNVTFHAKAYGFSETSGKYHIVVSPDGGTTWFYGGEYTSTGKWSTIGEDVNLSLAVANCSNVIVRMIVGNDKINRSDWRVKDIYITGEVITSEEIASIRTLTLSKNYSSAGEVKVSPAGNKFINGTNVSIVASTNTDFSFAKWTNGGETVLGTETTLNRTMSSDLTIKAFFVGDIALPIYGTSVLDLSKGSMTSSSSPRYTTSSPGTNNEISYIKNGYYADNFYVQISGDETAYYDLRATISGHNQGGTFKITITDIETATDEVDKQESVAITSNGQIIVMPLTGALSPGLKKIRLDFVNTATDGYLYNIKDICFLKRSLNEAYDYSPIAATNVDVVLTRNISANSWSTIMLPFDITASALSTALGTSVTLATFSGYSENSLVFSSVDAITANTPCMIKVGAAVDEPKTITGVNIVTTGYQYVDHEGIRFQGVYESTKMDAGDYFVSSNKLYKATASTKNIKPFRAYFKNVPAGARLSFFDDETTGISEVNGKMEETRDYYNLSGQRVAQPTKGLYIVNGKKIIIK